MSALLRISAWIDAINARMGALAAWLVLIACLISAGNAISRYLFSASSNAWLEIQWYLFSGIFLLGAAHTLRVNEHVRVDLVYAHVSPIARLCIDIFGIIFFLLPATIILIDMTWPFFLDSWLRQEESNNAGGLIRWPVKLLLPLGFALLSAQGVSELIKRVAALYGRIAIDTRYDRPTQ
jgi:TRAP-type mannitol/chloroaromatic compound transport system permease small subunit